METTRFYTKKYTSKSGNLKTYKYSYQYNPTNRGVEKLNIRNNINKILPIIDKTLKRSQQARVIVDILKDDYNTEVTLEYVLSFLRARFGAVKKIED